MDGDLAAADYQCLLQFRTGLRRFLHWSAEQAERAGLTPAQHCRKRWLNYLLSHGCKEGLVDHLRDWPGVHCVRALLDGEPLVGAWFDRTQEY